MSEKPKITAFYEGAGMNQDRELLLLDLWKQAWTRIGWEPGIVKLSDCILHPKFSLLLTKANSFPTQLDPFTHRMCFLRWLAFAGVGGVVADYDVFPKGPIPQFPEHIATTVQADLHPGFIVAPKQWCERFVDEMLNYRMNGGETFLGQPHVCDQEIMARIPNLFDQVEDLCRIFGDPGWEEKPLVHFSNASLRHRHQSVKYLMDL